MTLVAQRYLGGLRDVVTGRRRVYYGWLVLSVGTVAMALGSGLSMAALGLYVQPLEREFGWTRAEVSLGFSASVLAGGLAGPLVGIWIDARGPRASIVAGGILAALSFVLLAATETLWQFYLFYALHAVCRQMMFFLPFQALLSRWFERRRGVALSILGSGFSIGGFIILPIVALMIGWLDWRGAYLVSGLVMALFFIPAGLFVVRNRPPDVGERRDGHEADAFEARDEHRPAFANAGMSLREAIRTPFFWTCAVGFMLLFFGMVGWTVHQVPFYESKGISRTTAALIVSLSAGLSIFTRLGMGLIADRFERFEGIVVALLALLALSMATLLVSTSPVAIAVAVLFWVIGASAGPMVETLVLLKAFGVRYFATILGAVLVVETSGEIISPSVAGAIFDRSGSYEAALIMFASAFGLGIVLFLVAARMKLPLGQRAGLPPDVERVSAA